MRSVRPAALAAAILLAACTPPGLAPKPWEGAYGVICSHGAGGGLSGLRLDVSPSRRSPGVDIVMCNDACIRPRVVAIAMDGATIIVTTRDSLPPQDGVSVAPERHFTITMDEGVATIEGLGQDYVLPSTILQPAAKSSCPAGSTAVEPKVELAP